MITMEKDLFRVLHTVTGLQRITPTAVKALPLWKHAIRLVPGFPAMLNVSVTQIDAVNGSIFISWAKPRNFDATSAPGPYVFKIYRSLTAEPSDFTAIDSVLTADLNDTTYTDQPVNTVYFPYYYLVKMFNNTPGNRFEMRPGESEIASSLYIDITPNDNQLSLVIRKKAPWINTEYIIYRKYGSGGYDSIATTTDNRYVDKGLKNGVTYSYQVKSIGWRPIDGVTFNNANMSHINSGTPADLTAPCAPYLFVDSHCDSAVNILTWTNPNKSCADDVVRYKVYYSPEINGKMDSIVSISPATDTVYYHRFDRGLSLSGCYTVTAVDSVGNESSKSSSFCVDKCPLYSLPNVFTPNGNNVNDNFHSNNLNHVVEKVDMKVFNRYGELVFETSDPDINWNGKYRNTDRKLVSGVYYYICDVYEPRITGIEIRTLVGFIHLYADGNGKSLTK